MNKLIVSTCLGVAVLVGGAYCYAKASDDYRLTHCAQAPDGTWLGLRPDEPNEWFCKSIDRWLDDRLDASYRAHLLGK